MTGLDWTAATWRKSRRSGGNGECVDWARIGTVVGVRDSHDRTGAMLTFDERDWRAFVNDVRGRRAA